MLSLNTDVFSHQIIKIKRGLTVDGEMLLDFMLLECGFEIHALVSSYSWPVMHTSYIVEVVPVIQYGCSTLSPLPQWSLHSVHYCIMIGNWKAWKLGAFNGKQQVKWFEEIRMLVQKLVTRGVYCCGTATYSWDSNLLWCCSLLEHQ